MYLTMNTKERERLKVIHRIANNELSIVNAAMSLSISERQMYRILLRHRSKGDAGLIHKLRGKVSLHRTEPHIRQQVADLFRQKYHGYGATLFAEKLEEFMKRTIECIHPDETLLAPVAEVFTRKEMKRERAGSSRGGSRGRRPGNFRKPPRKST